MAAAEPPRFQAKSLQVFKSHDARQGVAVNKDYVYVVNNFRITKHDKKTGEALLQWDGGNDVTGPLKHLDSGMVYQGDIYAAHSNYPNFPMTSSIEIWDAETMEHKGSHSFGIDIGSFTWMDRYDGHWWGAFANYDKTQKNQHQPYGYTNHTQVVKMDDDFNILEKWTLPKGIVDLISPMSNSGGSWGKDGYLYITGHDNEEVYVMSLPKTSSELKWIATVDVPGMYGQGLAWDRTEKSPILWTIRKSDHTVNKVSMPEIKVRPTHAVEKINGPSDFNTKRK